MKRNVEYVPAEIRKEAFDFFMSIKDDVEIYKKVRQLGALKESKTADKFVAWWDLERFAKYPQALIILYEHMGTIYDFIDEYKREGKHFDSFEQLQLKLVLFYSFLNMYRMTDDKE